ncbi:MAG: hypothetical protein HQ567_20300 [Candidatus Nealsonbacteria bacterium]|nr:hypothetical protein [Candidatus Nealsonbacteria bacterium]
MADAADIHGTAFKNGSATLLARVVGADGAPITQADVASASYSVYLLDDRDADARAAVTGHDGVALSVASIVFNSLQTDSLWTVDATGYNFRHVLDASANQALPTAGRRYLVEFTLTPNSGQVILVRFRVNVI